MARRVAMLERLLAASSDHLYLYDADGHYLYANRAGARALGRTPDEMIGRTWRELGLPADLMEPFDRERRTVMETGEPVTDEVEFPTVEGVRCYEYTITPVPDQAGGIEGTVATVTDVTRRERVEEALRRSEERYRLTARATDDVLWDYDVATGTLEWSENLSRLFGYPPEEAGDDFGSWRERIHPKERERVTAGFTSALDRRDSWWSAEHRFRRADGTYADVVDRAYLLYDDDGRPRRAVGSMMDITDRKRAEALLRQAHDELRALIRSAPLAILTIDPEGRIELWNEAAEELFGWSEEEVLGRRPPFVPPDKQEEFRALRERARRGEHLTGVELVRRRRDGRPVEVSLSTAPIRNADGRVVAILSMLEDIGQRKRAERERERLLRRERETRETLEWVIESRERLIRGFTHDVKNRLNAAAGLAELIESGLKGELNESQRQAVAAGRRSIRTALRLIDDLLDIARAEAGELPVEREDVDLVALVRAVAREFELPAERKGLRLWTRAPDRLPSVRTDPDRVEQIVVNLLSNAVKYTDEGEVVVRVEAPTDRGAPEAVRRVAVHVTDTGVGIPEDRRDLLFQEFTRLDPRREPGAGIGLAVSRRIAHALGGEITFVSRVGEGSTFTLWLPLDAERRETGGLAGREDGPDTRPPGASDD